MSLRQAIVGQFKKPRGCLGSIAGWIMANRRSNRERNHWTVELLNVRSGDRVIEIGCGPGLALEICLLRADRGQLVGIDYSQTMLDQARARNAKASQEGRLVLRLASIDNLPANIGSFDKAYSVNVVQFFPNQLEAFRRIHSLLKSKGVVATTYMPRTKNPSRADAFNLAEEVKQHMETAGFTNIRIEELPLEPVPAVCIIGEHP